MSTVQIPKALHRKPNPDPHYLAAAERAKQAAERLRTARIIDAKGQRIRHDLPADMQEGHDRDFGG